LPSGQLTLPDIFKALVGGIDKIVDRQAPAMVAANQAFYQWEGYGSDTNPYDAPEYIYDVTSSGMTYERRAPAYGF
jgi:hypothetical protein